MAIEAKGDGIGELGKLVDFSQCKATGYGHPPIDPIIRVVATPVPQAGDSRAHGQISIAGFGYQATFRTRLKGVRNMRSSSSRKPDRSISIPCAGGTM